MEIFGRQRYQSDALIVINNFRARGVNNYYRRGWTYTSSNTVRTLQRLSDNSEISAIIPLT